MVRSHPLTSHPFPSTRSPLDSPMSIKCDHYYCQQTTRVAADMFPRVFSLLSASVARYLSVKCGNWQQRAEITSPLRPTLYKEDALLWQQFVPKLHRRFSSSSSNKGINSVTEQYRTVGFFHASSRPLC